MLERLRSICEKNERYVIGLMSGTSADGIDAALVKISGSYTSTTVEEIAFEVYEYPADVRERIFRLFDSASPAELCHMNFLIGKHFALAANNIAKKAGINIRDVDLIGSHGQTIYHIPEPCEEYPLKSTLQIGESAIIAHDTGVVTVSDFRVADMAAGGVGAPLVPYTEFLLYSDAGKNIALLNIGGIGNITAIPQNACANDIIAFDTGPGNMIIDHLVQKIYSQNYDKNGDIAASGTACPQILAQLMDDRFIKKAPPKATGREYYGKNFSENFYSICKNANKLDADIIATATALTAQSISYSIKQYVPFEIAQLIVGGGGAYNHTLMQMLRSRMPKIDITTHENLNKNSNAKEAIAFAILANETINGNTSNLPSVTGASCRKILGKISL